MSKIRVVAAGKTEAAQSNARGKLFEQIIGRVLNHHGYDISKHTLNVNLAGMEIDIHGRTTMTGVPIYAECKCYSSDVPAEKLQTFYGKYMTQWWKDKRCQGLFVALPGVNSHALGFYRQDCEDNQEITLGLIARRRCAQRYRDFRYCIESTRYCNESRFRNRTSRRK